MTYPWAVKTKGMQIGDSKRIVCPYCKKDKSMSVKRGVKGTFAFCFRCMEQGEFEEAAITIADMKECGRDSLPDARNMNTILSECIPLDELGGNHPARNWLLLAGIDPANAPCKFHPPTFRAVWILPDSLLMRALYPRNAPKYLLLSDNKDNILPAMYYSSGDKPHTVVICEDVLSAYRMQELDGVAGVSILGTNPTARHMQVILNLFGFSPQYIVWTDNDNGGDKGAYKLGKHLRTLGAKFKRVITEHDPKKYSTQDIGKVLLGSTLM